ncbi:hypothetical protein KIF53_06615 [Chromobacterium subtsugae]|uniref:Uncharacterized protein n=1 Tax=Chromobacterium subtsugae TaxID=251747 RepID=A0ABS7FB46_9NEIS|nr:MULTISPECIES: hypothetical protein [Chromobacterium]MBW7566177.1 hypothetical protein [Chromobacterium subtsugae]MBW8287298.1 hypothetical protein [Chromobacterium subtsugae]WSE90510.1 hypothetical protein U6115_16640 [Chromobacterium subtsugae]WVH58882.1 hypothetical protein U6151_16665 [Chromobacterium subtsugae]
MIHLSEKWNRVFVKIVCCYVAVMLVFVVNSMLRSHGSADRLVMMISDISVLDGCGVSVVDRFNNDKVMMGSYRVSRKIAMKSWLAESAHSCIQKLVSRGWTVKNGVYCKNGVAMMIDQSGVFFKGEEVVVVDMEYGFPQSKLCHE